MVTARNRNAFSELGDAGIPRRAIEVERLI
jgi:hypothetical protein